METMLRSELERAISRNDITGFREKLVKQISRRIKSLSSEELWPIFQKAAGNSGVDWNQVSEGVYDDGIDFSTRTHHLQDRVVERFTDDIMTFIKRRRNFYRVGFDEDIEVKRVEGAGMASEKACIDNISAGGVQFKSGTCFSIGEKIELSVSAGDENWPVIVTGTVVRAEKIGDDLYEIGVCVCGVNMQGRKDLQPPLSWLYNTVTSRAV